MCLACEQDAMWFAYLQRKGLITPEGYLVEEPPFVAGVIEPPPAQVAEKAETTDQSASEATNKSAFSCDDPTAE
jgi:hypothetical protein